MRSTPVGGAVARQATDPPRASKQERQVPQETSAAFDWISAEACRPKEEARQARAAGLLRGRLVLLRCPTTPLMGRFLRRCDASTAEGDGGGTMVGESRRAIERPRHAMVSSATSQAQASSRSEQLQDYLIAVCADARMVASLMVTAIVNAISAYSIGVAALSSRLKRSSVAFMASLTIPARPH